jgi:hypothetical protein
MTMAQKVERPTPQVTFPQEAVPDVLLDKMLRDLKVSGMEREIGPYMMKHVALHLLYQGWKR